MKPLLPDTHCHVAFPLISRDEVVGALEIQTYDEGYSWEFDEYWDDYQLMVDHIAIAIDNACLFSQLKEKLESPNDEAV